MHSLVAAARIGSSEALDVLLEAGADASAWTKAVALVSLSSMRLAFLALSRISALWPNILSVNPRDPLFVRHSAGREDPSTTN